MSTQSTLNPYFEPLPAPPADKILTTMAEKVKAYEDFFASEVDKILIVVGTQNGGEGKSAALHAVKKRPLTTLFLDSDRQIMHSIGYDVDDDYSGNKFVFHLYETDGALINALCDKYKARVVRFARGNE